MEAVYCIRGKLKYAEVSRLSGLKLKSVICQKEGLNKDDIYLENNGRVIGDEDIIDNTAFHHVCFRLPGGKGGFGSMLRMIGAQIEKTTNREACRDLSGRRLRDINDEKRLAEWLSKQADKEREREEKKRAKLEKLASDPKHYFDDPKYHEQKQTIMENIDDALTQGMQASASEEPSTSGVSMKRKEQDDGISRKKQKMWVGIDLDSDSSSDEENFQSYLQRVKESDKSDMQKGDIPVQKDSRTTDNLQCSEEKKQEILDDTVISESASTDTITITESVNLEDYASAVDLEVLGLERLKYALTAVGLKCGGTLQERAQRLFSIKGLKHDQIDQSLFAKPSRGKAKRK